MTSMPIRDATWLTDRYTAILDWVRTHVGDPQTEELAEALLVQAARLSREGTGRGGEQLPSAPTFPTADMAARFIQLLYANPIDWEWVERLSPEQRLAYGELEANFGRVFMSSIMRDYPELVPRSAQR